MLRIDESDIRWLWEHQPLLASGLSTSKIAGTIEISAYYDGHARRVVSNQYHSLHSHQSYIADQFAIEIRLDSLDSNGWPKVKEVGFRHQSVARRYGVPVTELHFYRNGDACLGLAYPWDPPLTLENFVEGLVEPFFYRLSYADIYGLTAARNDLWPEYSHGSAGRQEHFEDIRRLSRLSDYLSGALDTSRSVKATKRKIVQATDSDRRP